MMNEPPDGLPCLTLWQPWASLIFTGAKRHETRGWRLPARLTGRLVGIHAAAKSIGGSSPDLDELCRKSFGSDYAQTLPRSCLLGTVIFDRCQPVEDARLSATADDVLSGDWSDGRYAWHIAETAMLATPIPASGRQGFWYWRSRKET